MQPVLEALALDTRRNILADLAHVGLNAGEITSRFTLSNPSIPQHLSIPEAAGLVTDKGRGRYVSCRQVRGNLVNTSSGFVQKAWPVTCLPKHGSAALAASRASTPLDEA